MLIYKVKYSNIANYNQNKAYVNILYIKLKIEYNKSR